MLPVFAARCRSSPLKGACMLAYSAVIAATRLTACCVSWRSSTTLALCWHCCGSSTRPVSSCRQPSMIWQRPSPLAFGLWSFGECRHRVERSRDLSNCVAQDRLSSIFVQCTALTQPHRTARGGAQHTTEQQRSTIEARLIRLVIRVVCPFSVAAHGNHDGHLLHVCW